MTQTAASMSATIAKSLAITNPLVKYRALVATKQIVQDPAQVRLALHLQKLYDDLKDYEPQVEYSARIDQIARTIDHESQRRTISKPSAWRTLVAAKEQRDSLALTRSFTSHESAMNLTSPKGLMLHGEVGTGKSMLIDLFADCLPTKKKRRWHFNTFMLETLAKLETLRKSKLGGVDVNPENDSALLWLAKDMIQESPILFLDEFQMPDRAASKILTNLMTSFFQLGGVLIATSNRMPEELAKAAGLEFAAPRSTSGFAGWSLGPQRSMSSARYAGRGEFAAFLDVLKARCDVWEMDGKKDYRRSESCSIAPPRDHLEVTDEVMIEENDLLQESEPVADTEKEAILPQNYQVITGDAVKSDAIDSIIASHSPSTSIHTPIPWQSATMYVYGRTIVVPQTYSGIAKWSFSELCQANLGPADYISLASTYHTLVLTDVPVLTWLMKNEARRFITLLDALYESRCKLLVTAAASPDDLFFPEQQTLSSQDTYNSPDDAVYSETLSEVYQDATAPFRPNILTQNPNYAESDPEPDYTHARLAGLLSADALEDDPPNRPPQQRSSPFARSFGRTDAEMERAPIDPDEPSRYTQPLSQLAPGLGGIGAGRLDFSRTSAFTGEDERFAYKRAESRLWELCGAKWWAREGNDWHRPLPIAARRWEARQQELEMQRHEGPISGAQISDTAAPGAPGMIDAADLPPPPVLSSRSKSRTDAVMGSAVEDDSRDARSFKTNTAYSPFRTSTEAPPKFNWTHFWGTTIWGPRAGNWGKGPEGLKDRPPKNDEQK